MKHPDINRDLAHALGTVLSLVTSHGLAVDLARLAQDGKTLDYERLEYARNVHARALAASREEV